MGGNKSTRRGPRARRTPRGKLPTEASSDPAVEALTTFFEWLDQRLGQLADLGRASALLDVLRSCLESAPSEREWAFRWTLLRQWVRRWEDRIAQAARDVLARQERRIGQLWVTEAAHAPAYTQVRAEFRRLGVPLRDVQRILHESGALKWRAVENLRDLYTSARRSCVPGRKVADFRRALSSLLTNPLGQHLDPALKRHLSSNASAILAKASGTSRLARHLQVFRNEEPPARGFRSPATQVSIRLPDVCEARGATAYRAETLTAMLLVNLRLPGLPSDLDRMRTIVRLRRQRADDRAR